ncbi:MAG: type ISP restriction/modification enzyme [Bryobacteraceae bacterium]
MEHEIRTGHTTEHTHRPALKTLLETLQPGVTATNEPGRVACGAPDFVVTKAGPLTIGYVETKDVGKSLDDAERSEQLRRYRTSLHNLILTDYLDFRWFVDGERRKAALLATVSRGGKLSASAESVKEVSELLLTFLEHKAEGVSSPKELAERMARLTHIIRDIIVQAFEREKASDSLKDLRKAFSSTLIPDMDLPKNTGQFADMYAQTIAYGLFAARWNHPPSKPFQRIGAAGEVPKTNPFLRRIFEIVTGTELNDEPYAPFVDDLVQLLGNADIGMVLINFGKRTKQEDPVVHFYETFLASYDPKLRESRGVYYTPEPVVLYIVKSVDHLLKTKFLIGDGLADTVPTTFTITTRDQNTRTETLPKVLVLDPACGTGTFLYYIIDQIRDRFIQSGNTGLWASYIESQLLNRLYGFELLMAPYAVAHFKLALQLAGQDLPDALRKKLRYDFAGASRLSVFLTNTLEQIEHEAPTLLGPFKIVTEEAQAADHVKRDMPILVVIGNPPYSGHSANRSWKLEDGKRVATFIGQLLREYYTVDGKPLGERNPKWLQDDYVKFVRWGQWKIERAGGGVLAFITAHGYLDNPTFRGMRQSLLNSFTEIYLFDLHGNANKKETCDDGSPDVNVFDIQQGVAIGLFVKQPGKSGPPRVYHASIKGNRHYKYKQLLAHDVSNTEWQEVEPKSPYYYFVPIDRRRESEYSVGVKLTDLFDIKNVGIVTARDGLTIRFTPDEMWDLVQDFVALDPEDARMKYKLGKDAQEWKVTNAQRDLRTSGPTQDKVVSIQYRPFDVRSTYYTGQSVGFMGRPRPDVMFHLLGKNNLALHVCRQLVSDVYQHAIATRHITDDCYVSNKSRERGYTLPLYVNSGGSLNLDPRPRNSHGQVSNLNPHMIHRLEAAYGVPMEVIRTTSASFTPEDVFAYLYALLYSQTFRDRYFDLLQRDFPRIPFTRDFGLFKRLASLGTQLVDVHTCRSDVSTAEVTYPAPGDDLVAPGHPRFTDVDPSSGKPLESGRVYINGQQFFNGVANDEWEFQMGSYQVCEKWLKDRRGRTLTNEELNHYRRVIVCVRRTLVAMQEIEAAIPGWPIA